MPQSEFIQKVRLAMISSIPVFTVIYGLVNAWAPARHADYWQKPFQFAAHPYEENMATAAHFTGPFLSKVRVAPSAGAKLVDHSKATHLNCSSSKFTDEKQVNKCKMMRSAPMYLGNVEHSWSVLGAQSSFVLTKHMFLIFIAFCIFWWSEFVLSEAFFGTLHQHHVIVRNVVVFAVVVIFACSLGWDVTGDMSKDVAIGSVSTAFSFVVLCLLIICFEYGGMNGKLYTVADAKPGDIIAPKNEHMFRNIYLSYACLLIMPLAVVFILQHTHDAIVDVQIQLVFFSFIFYATLDVFQTRTTAVLLCLQDAEPDPKPTETTAKVENLEGGGSAQQKLVPTKLTLQYIKFFVVLAFFLCKCFALMPGLVLMQREYIERGFQRNTLGAQYIVLFGFAVADLVHITVKTFFGMPADCFKLFCIIFYTWFIFIATLFVDYKDDTPSTTPTQSVNT